MTAVLCSLCEAGRGKVRAGAFKILVASIAKLSAGQLGKLANEVSAARSAKFGLAAVERANPP